MSINLDQADRDALNQFVELAEIEMKEHDILQERMKVRVPKAVIRKRAIHRTAFMLAKANSDSNYEKYAKYVGLMRIYRDKVLRKYGAKAKSVYMSNSRGGGGGGKK